MSRQGWLYEVDLTTVRFRARGLDAAHRIARKLTEVMQDELESNREVLAVEDLPYPSERAMRCDASIECRADLHDRGCPRQGGNAKA